MTLMFSLQVVVPPSVFKKGMFFKKGNRGQRKGTHNRLHLHRFLFYRATTLNLAQKPKTGNLFFYDTDMLFFITVCHHNGEGGLSFSSTSFVVSTSEMRTHIMACYIYSKQFPVEILFSQRWTVYQILQVCDSKSTLGDRFTNDKEQDSVIENRLQHNS